MRIYKKKRDNIILIIQRYRWRKIPSALLTITLLTVIYVSACTRDKLIINFVYFSSISLYLLLQSILMATLRKCVRCNLQKRELDFYLAIVSVWDYRPQTIPQNENFPLNNEHICSTCYQLHPIHLFIGVNNQRFQTCHICRVI